MGQYSKNLFGRKGRSLNAVRAMYTSLDQPKNPNDPALIGVRGGFCQRTACRAEGAFAWHTGRYQYYCDTCARDINRANREDAMRMYGVPFLIIRPEVITAEDRAKLAAKGIIVPEAQHDAD